MLHIRHETLPSPMRFLTDKIARLWIGWNEKQLTEVDFYRLCRRYNIEVREIPMSVAGFYFRVMGRNVIAIDSKLAGPAKLAVMFHELGHFLFHTPETGPAANFHGLGLDTRQEREADAFALCALIPISWIQNRHPQELIHEGLSPEMIAARFEVLARYGI